MEKGNNKLTILCLSMWGLKIIFGIGIEILFTEPTPQLHYRLYFAW